MNAKQLSTWKEIVCLCKSWGFGSINVASQERSEAILVVDALVELAMPELAALLELERVEYPPGTYCEDIECKHYHSGQFDNHCNDCPAYAFYLWLQGHGYRLLGISRKACTLAAHIREALEEIE